MTTKLKDVGGLFQMQLVPCDHSSSSLNGTEGLLLPIRTGIWYLEQSLHKAVDPQLSLPFL